MDFTSLLLNWYDRNRRSLPWRGSRDPYVIWVSEIIFQQTRIEQGTDYFIRFTRRFPDLRSLAEASEDEVLRLWQGLGYYSRARNMLYTARLIMDACHGNFPREFDSIRKLKGVGDYTASCIASICFNGVHAAVDGNVYRVLSRFLADDTPIDSSAGKVRFKLHAQNLISQERPGDFNEAVMDLGATVCKPRSPLCTECPVSFLCKAFALKIQSELPVKSPAMKKSGSVMNYLLIKTADGVAIQKREGIGIWKGLYQFPMVPGDLSLDEIAAECNVIYGIQPARLKEIRRVKHTLTHTDLDIRFYSVDAQSGIANPVLLLVPEREIKLYPFPKPLVDFLSDPEVE